MKTKQQALIVAIATGIVTAGLSLPAVAQFYKGKTITILNGTRAGGGIDLLIRPFKPVWSEYIPGKPNMIIKNIPGAGGQKAYNILFNNSKPDGLTIAFSPWRPLAHILKSPGIRYRIEDGHMIAAAGNIPLSIVRSDLLPNKGLKSGADMFKVSKTIVVGGSRRDSLPDLLNRLSMSISGVPYRFVFGYRGQATTVTALRQGEIQSFPSFAPAYKQIVEDNIIKTGVGIAAWVHSNFDLDGNPIDKFTLIPGIKPFHVVYREKFGKLPSGPKWEAYKWISSLQYSFGIGVWAPPGTPPELVKILRESHLATVKDPRHIPERMRKVGIDLNWADPSEIPGRLKNFRKIGPEVVATIKGFIAEEAKRVKGGKKRKRGKK